MRKKYYYEMTKYPKIFQQTYWGNFAIDLENDEIERDIIKNRNKFVEEYNIKNYDKDVMPLKIISPLFDHMELYKCKEGYVYITSPYSENSKAAGRCKFYEYEELYAYTAFTYIKKFKDKNEYKAFFNNLNQNAL